MNFSMIMRVLRFGRNVLGFAPNVLLNLQVFDPGLYIFYKIYIYEEQK